MWAEEGGEEIVKRRGNRTDVGGSEPENLHTRSIHDRQARCEGKAQRVGQARFLRAQHQLGSSEVVPS